MEIITCRSCGKLFNYIRGERICPVCQKKMEEKFIEVKKYIRENKEAEIHTISEEMDVSVSQINRWIREGRLVFSNDSPIGIPCESCGAMIKTGRYCDKCKLERQNEFSHAAGLDQPKETPRRTLRDSKENRMRFLDSKH